MKVIAPIAVIAILLLQFSGAVPQSSVGGPMTLALVFLGATIAVGMHEAWAKKRGALGWIVSIVVAFVGGFVAADTRSAEGARFGICFELQSRCADFNLF